MRRDLARYLKWKLPVIWEASDEPAAAIPAEPVTVVHVHFHFGGPALSPQFEMTALPQPRAAITDGKDR